MKHRYHSIRKMFAAAAAGLLLCTVSAADAALIIRDGQANGKIYVTTLDPYHPVKPKRGEKPIRPTDAQVSDQLLEAAVQDLNYHLKKMSGAELTVVTSDSPAAYEPGSIILGKLAEKEAKPAGNDPEAFRVKVKDSRIYIGSNTNSGAAYGIYKMLELLGCNWVMPGEDGEVIPEKKTVSLEDGTDVEEAPAFRKRISWISGRPSAAQQHDLRLFNLRQRMQWYSDPDFEPSGHSWAWIIRGNIEEFKKNPELYALTPDSKGILKRQGPQFESTDPRVIEMCVKYVRSAFEKNGWPKDKLVCLPMGPSDGGDISQSFESRMAGTGRISPDCGLPDGTDLVILLMNQVLERLEKEYPNLHLGFLLYSWHMDYPLRYTPHPKIIPVIADINLSRYHGVGDASSKSRFYYRNILEKWGELHAKQGNTLIYRPYSWDLANYYMAYSKLKMWGDDIPFMKKIGVSEMRLDNTMAWAPNAAHTYLFYRMAWNPDRDWHELTKEFCRTAYGPEAAEPMAQYYFALTKRQAEAGQEAGRVYSYPLMFDLAFVREMEALIAKAEKAAKTEIQKKRIRGFAAYPLRHLKLYLEFWEHMKNFRFLDAGAKISQMKEEFAAEGKENHFFTDYYQEKTIKYFDNFIKWSVTSTTNGYEIFFRVPNRLKTAIDRDNFGEELNYYGSKLVDKDYIETQTWGSTWDAQGLAGYRTGSAWYRIHVTPSAKDLDAPFIGFFMGGADNTVKVWCNDELIGESGPSSFQTPSIFDLTGKLKAGEDNVIVVRTRRNGNWELGTGGIMMPCFLFKGPRKIDTKENIRPFRVLPGGVIEYIK